MCRAGFAAGAHVITANKGPVAFASQALLREAAAAGVSFLFEGAVMDGVPIFNLVRETMPAVDIRGFRGVVNSTTNYIIGALEENEPFDAALARMQALGIAEADPSLDVDGWDAAAKTAALANVLLDARSTPLEIAREVWARPRRAGAHRARARRRLKLVAAATGRGRDVRASVSLTELAADDPLADSRSGQCARARDLAARPHRDHGARRRTRADGVCAPHRSRHGGQTRAGRA
jgi:homoserine dehydrogenase